MKIPANEVTLDPYLLGKKFKRHADKVILRKAGVTKWIMWQSPGWKDGAEQCGSVPSNPRRFSGELSVRPRRPVPNARRTAPQIDIWRRDAPGIRHGPSC